MPMTQHDGGESLMQIGDVAEHTGLSLRTIRYYEEAGLVVPSTRTVGGFRLYTTEDDERLQLIKRMKPLGFTLEEMRDLLRVLDLLADESVEATREALQLQVNQFAEVVEARCERLKEQLTAAAGFADLLRARSAYRIDQSVEV